MRTYEECSKQCIVVTMLVSVSSGSVLVEATRALGASDLRQEDIAALTRRWPLLSRMVRHPVLLCLVLSVFIVASSSTEVTRNTDWQFFTWGGDLLFGKKSLFIRDGDFIDPQLPGGLNIYANYPFLQIGPPALFLGAFLDVGPGNGSVLAAALVQALGLLFVSAVAGCFPTATLAGRLRLLLASCIAIIGWGQLAHYRHLDDALALSGTGAAAWLIQRQRYAAAGAALGLAAASKPWAVPVLALVLAVPTWRARVRAAASAGGVMVLSWGPFILADPRTLDVGEVGLYLASDSSLWALGVRSIGDGEHLRLLQFGVGFAVAAFLVLRGWWPLAPLAAFAIRLMLEPSSYPYYAVAVIAAALLADTALRMAVPVTSLITAAGWMAVAGVHGNAAAAVRLAEYGGLIVLVLLLSLRTPIFPPPRARAGQAARCG